MQLNTKRSDIKKLNKRMSSVFAETPSIHDGKLPETKIIIVHVKP
jgi:hypothetical protein